MSGKRQFFSARSEAQAVSEAAARFGVAPGELAYRARPSQLRLGRVVIEVDPDAPRRTAPTAVPPAPALTEPRHERAAAPPPVERRESPPREGARAEEAWIGGAVPPTASDAERLRLGAEAAARLAGLELQAQVTGEEAVDGPIHVELAGRGHDKLVARQGELLRTVDYLLRRMVRELPDDGVTVDSGGFRAERESVLRSRAREAAEQARTRGEAVLLEPLPAAERRVIHLTIQDEPGVTSASEGDGELRRVRIRPE
jgi:spoIIIJ-associated protein